MAEDFADAALIVDGVSQSLLTSVVKNTKSGDTPVYVLTDGFAGFSPGPGECTITVKYMIPMLNTEEFNFDEAVTNKSLHRVQLYFGVRDYIGEGKFTEATSSKEVDSAAEGEAVFVGEFLPLSAT